LAAPLVLLADRVIAASHGVHTPASRILAVAAVVWLAAGLLFLARGRLSTVSGLLTVFYSLTACVVLLEASAWGILGSRVFLRSRFLYPPGSRWILAPDPRQMPGVEGPGAFSIDESGLRGTPVPPGAYRMVAVGGSTTECLFLDDAEAWPHLLMQEMTARRKRPVWIGNAGVAGHGTIHHLRLAESLPPIRNAHAWILLTGFNDLLSTLHDGGAATNRRLEESARRFLDGRFVLGRLFQPYAWLDRMLLYQVAVLAMGGDAAPPWHSDDYAVHRRERVAAPVVALPSIETGLAEYAQRIERLGSACRELRKRCLFLTQPALWRPDLNPEEAGLLWLGRVRMPDGAYHHVPVRDLATGLDRYNQTLLQVCQHRGLEVFDLAAAIPKSTAVFFDDCHFTELGARLVAKAIAEHFGRARFE
jgi:hypothetical protein